MSSSNSIQSIREYKVILVGNGGVGKTSIVRRLAMGEFDPRYTATLGADVTAIVLYFDDGPIQFNVWDCAGQEQFGGRRDGYYTGAESCIAVISDSELSSKSIPAWIRSVKQTCGDIPTVTVRNKCEVGSQLEHPDAIRVSARNSYNLEQPFLELARKLTGNCNLAICERPCVAPPIVHV